MNADNNIYRECWKRGSSKENRKNEKLPNNLEKNIKNYEDI